MRLSILLLAMLSLGACNRAPERTTPASSSMDASAAGATDASVADATAEAASNTLVVYKSPTCGCCAKWVDHMRDAGFTVRAHDVADVDLIKRQRGVPSSLASCHTAIIGKYVIEGHVPAEDVRRLLRDRPTVAGLAVPGMPMGSPGMEGATRDRYDVLSFDSAGRSATFASH